MPWTIQTAKERIDRLTCQIEGSNWLNKHREELRRDLSDKEWREFFDYYKLKMSSLPEATPPREKPAPRPAPNSQDIYRLCETIRETGLASFIGEMWMAGWKKSTSTKSPEIKMTLADDDEVAPFEMATIAKGKQAGQRYLVIAFELDEI